MAKSNDMQAIKVYCRLKPLKNKEESIKYVIKKDVSGYDLIFIKCSDLYKTSKYKQNGFKFQYHGIFDEYASQLSVFENVAAPIVNKFILGFNGTIFTYGQTGSGKTHTICGAIHEEGRGIIPRSFQHLFDVMDTKARNESVKYEVSISYIEIYNEVVYDLLNSSNDSRYIQTDKSFGENDETEYDQSTNSVSFYVDKKGHIIFQNLSVHPVKRLSEALQLIKEGDYRRKISPTPMNIQSSRSHCICTIYLTQTSKNSSRIYKSKLNLVDLAGSERIWKSKVGKKTLSEARYINLSLHFLEQVIMTLANSDNKTHVPYRNSMMTSILRDSLGGNCFTAMVATLVLNRKCITESISTCRFSQRVAAVENRVVGVNWYVDSAKEVLLLRKEVELMRKQNNEEIVLNEQETEECENLIGDFLSITGSELKLPGNRNKIKHCFKLMKDAIDKKKIDTEDKLSDTNYNLTTGRGFLYSLNNMVERKAHLKENKITLLIQDHKKNKVIVASSDDHKFVKKINKLSWNVYEELNYDELCANNNDVYRSGSSKRQEGRGPWGARGDGNYGAVGDAEMGRRVSANSTDNGGRDDREDGDRHAPGAGRHRVGTVDAATNTMSQPSWTCGHYFHIVPCSQRHYDDPGCDLCHALPHSTSTRAKSSASFVTSARAKSSASFATSTGDESETNSSDSDVGDDCGGDDCGGDGCGGDNGHDETSIGGGRVREMSDDADDA